MSESNDYTKYLEILKKEYELSTDKPLDKLKEIKSIEGKILGINGLSSNINDSLNLLADISKKYNEKGDLECLLDNYKYKSAIIWKLEHECKKVTSLNFSTITPVPSKVVGKSIIEIKDPVSIEYSGSPLYRPLFSLVENPTSFEAFKNNKVKVNSELVELKKGINLYSDKPLTKSNMMIEIKQPIDSISKKEGKTLSNPITLKSEIKPIGNKILVKNDLEVTSKPEINLIGNQEYLQDNSPILVQPLLSMPVKQKEPTSYNLVEIKPPINIIKNKQ